jgi:hypothetical protein
MLSDVWLGTASAPCLPLLFQKEGVHIDLCLKLSIYKQVEEIYKTLQKLQTILITFFSFELSCVQFKSKVFQNQHRNCLPGKLLTIDCSERDFVKCIGTCGCYSLVSQTGKAVGELQVAVHFTKWCPSSHS